MTTKRRQAPDAAAAKPAAARHAATANDDAAETGSARVSDASQTAAVTGLAVGPDQGLEGEGLEGAAMLAADRARFARLKPHVITDPHLINRVRRANGLWKRAFDMAAAAAGLLVLAPVFLTIVVLIKQADGGPAFYGHTRVGQRGARFKCWKFRSMRPNSQQLLDDYLAANPGAAREWQETQKLRDDPRVTPIGRFLRETSLDELPQLWNVLRGEMSLVGPRPVLRNELDRYGRDRKYYLLVRPGITGLWQVSGRSTTTYDARVRLDRDYVRQWSLLKDLDILLRTVDVVRGRDGAF